MKDTPVEVEGTLPTGCTWELKPLMSDERIRRSAIFLPTRGGLDNDAGGVWFAVCPPGCGDMRTLIRILVVLAVLVSFCPACRRAGWRI